LFVLVDLCQFGVRLDLPFHVFFNSINLLFFLIREILMKRYSNIKTQNRKKTTVH
jgi:hypothetical protein